MKYADTISVDTTWFVDSDRALDSIEEYLRERGSVTRSGSTFEFEIERADLWDMRETLEEIVVELGAQGVAFLADKSKVVA